MTAHNAGMSRSKPTISTPTARASQTAGTRSASKPHESRAQQPGAIDIDASTPLLGGVSPGVFMRRHWQKKPCLIRQAVPGVKSPITRAELFRLAERDDVESRLIVHAHGGALGQGGAQAPDKGKKEGKGKPAASPAVADAAASWQLHHGPFSRRQLPPLSQGNWTLLVQNLEIHVPAAYELLQRFRFVPDARLDDLMISFATDGGGVGPHFDSYDVFLLQVEGRRKWRIGPLEDDALEPDVPLKILSRFEPEEEWVLEPGDMLYLPPRWAHDGVAQGECMTCSIGFRVPEQTELAREVLIRWLEATEPSDKPRLYRLYADPRQPATATPGAIPQALQDFAGAAVHKLLSNPSALLSALGEVLTEPKPRVWFEAGGPLEDGHGVRLDPRTRMVYDEQRIFANGESWRAAGKDARQLRMLADRRSLSADEVAKASPALRELLDQWAEDGWLHPTP